MRLLHDLVAMLRDAKAVAPERIDAMVESGSTDWAGSMKGPDLLLYRVRYTALVELQGVSGSLTHLLALVELWLAGLDRDHNRLASFEGEPVDAQRSDVLLRLELEEAVRYVTAESGYTGADQITWGGASWKPGEKTADRATHADAIEVLVPR